MRKTPEEESIRKGPASLLKISLWEFSVSACANQPPSYSVSGTSTPNGLSQTINGLKRLVSLLQTAPSTFLNFLLTFFFIKMSYLLLFTYVKISRSTMTLTENLTSFSVLPFLPLIRLLECLSEYVCGHNLTMKFPPDFHNCTGLNGLVNSSF